MFCNINKFTKFIYVISEYFRYGIYVFLESFEFNNGNLT